MPKAAYGWALPRVWTSFEKMISEYIIAVVRLHKLFARNRCVRAPYGWRPPIILAPCGHSGRRLWCRAVGRSSYSHSMPKRMVLYSSVNQMDWSDSSTMYRYPFEPAAPTAFDRGGINAIARDQDGRLWISARHLGVFRLDGAQWLEKGGIAALPNLYANLIVADTTGKVWLGYSDGRLAAVANGKATIYGEAEGLRTGSVTAIFLGRTLLVGGDLGLYAFHEGSFQRIKTTDGRLLDGITGMTVGRDDALWVNAVGGAMRIQWRDIQRALDSPDYEVPVRLFDANDGMSGGAQQIQPLHTAVEDAAGTIWFATTDGLASIDPLKLQHNSIAPKVEIQSMVTPERTYSPNTRLVFPAHTHDVTFNFTALSLAVPERVRFRVRLYGVDSRWRDIDGRRSISYSNLAPGSYTFGVAASNNDGVWSHDAATASFSIAPAPYQTTTFKVFLGLAIGLALWVISQLYVRRAVARVTTRMKERIYERERIARDLTIRFSRISKRSYSVCRSWVVTSSSRVGPRLSLQGLTDEARKALLKARNRVAGLREGSGDAGRDGRRPAGDG